MKETIHAILAGEQPREEAQIMASLSEEFSAGFPWFDRADN